MHNLFYVKGVARADTEFLTRLYAFVLSLFACVILFLLVVICLLVVRIQGVSYGSILDIGNKTVSAVHAIVCFTVGCLIAWNCRKDIMGDQHSIVDTYAFGGLGYGLFDMWAMYYVNVRRQPQRNLLSLSSLVDFVHKRPLMIGHHIFIILVGFPCVVMLAPGRGHFFIGCFLMTELSTPFVSLRAILSELHLKNGIAYQLNGILMLITFFTCRILLFPFLFWRYGHHVGVSTFQAVFEVPRKCALSCAILLAMQVYWFLLMLRGLAAYFRCSAERRVKFE